MPLNPQLASLYNFTLAPRIPVPLINGWNRLEGRPRSADFERSLRAEARDPLWFLTRQWQYGEFEGSDAGSPIDARLAYQTTMLETFIGGGPAAPYDPNQPLESRVEAETPPFDLTLHMQASRVLERLLQDKGRGARLGDFVGAYALDYASGVAGADTPEARALRAAGAAFLFDTQKLLAAVRTGSVAATIAAFPGMTSPESGDVTGAAAGLLAWFERTYTQPASPAPAWNAQRLDYPFSCGTGGGEIVLNAPAYDGTDLDWYDFDVAPGNASTGTAAPAAALSFVPAAIRFAGMPSARYWEFEDSRTDFGAIDANTTDVARLMLAEFMLLYANDWCVVPLELPVGSFTRLQGVLVTDVFGDQTYVRPADQGADSDWQRWSMYRLNGDDAAAMGLFLAPTLTAKSVPPAPEEVHFLRDEMANLIWGVEHRIMSKLGGPLDPEVGYSPPAVPPATAGARYALGTSVPPNWRPFLPAHVPGSSRSIQLQRGRLPSQPPQPLGEILNQPAPYFIAEEEIPRSGRFVKRGYRRARWVDGTTFLWLGRTSLIGRGEGLSGLVFDQVQESRTGESTS